MTDHNTVNSSNHTNEALRVYLGLLLCLIIASLLSSGRLVDMASNKEFGEDRQRWLSAAQAVDDAAVEMYLDRPAALVRAIRGAPAGETEEIILGDLAAQANPPETLPASPDVTLPPSAEGAGSGGQADTEATTGLTLPPTTTTTTTAPTTTTIPPLKTASPEDPLRIWVGGDSLGQYLGGHIGYKLAPPEVSNIVYDYHISTGLARPDFFNWPGRLTEVALREPRPELYVYMVGGNDDQAMVLEDGTRLEVQTPEWFDEYQARIGTFMDVVAFQDARLLWVGLPPMKSGVRAQIAPLLNELAAIEAEKRAWVIYIDTFSVLAGPDGGFSEFVAGPDGTEKLARQSDGVHITSDGSLWLAQAAWAEVTAQWPDLPPGPG